ncbi:immunity 49 family protein [Nocardiopsis suaedae]|uniref:Immunity 49 family protein n=1 Tax=Nocardiopsis suaedae TaxID=3018444 RepID=A0ABT4TMS8_9ACTN|nr:immunity 49 family protein [Nocardiopsis suaedae]MDA2805671.1 immunity 49 family protein [Nocardiopsis suaedae]
MLLLLIDIATPSGHKGGLPVFDSYADVFLAFLGEQAEFGAEEPASERTRAAMDQALADLDSCPAIPGIAIPPVVLLSQLVANDRDGFALALADALEAHRDAFSVGESVEDVDGLINLRILALACLARARGWEIGVDSEYLPCGVIAHAAAGLTSG